MTDLDNSLTRPADDALAYAVDGLTPGLVRRVSTVDHVVETLREAHAAGQAVIPWGAGSQMSLGSRPRRYDVALDLRGLNRVVEYDVDNLTISVEAGMRLAEVQARVTEEGQFLPLDPPFPDATLGGLIATDASGPWRLGYGALRDLVLGLRVVLADGTDLRLGGKTMKNVAGYDLVKLVIGSLGTLGVVCEATLRTYAKPPMSRTLSIFTYPEPLAAARLVGRILDLRSGPTALDIFSSAEGAYIILARLEGEPEAVAAQAEAIEKLCQTEYMRRIQITDAADSREVWQAAGAGGGYWDGPSLSYPVVVRVGVPIAQVGPFLDATRDILTRLSLPRLVTFQAGSGAGRVHLGDIKRLDNSAALTPAVEALRAAATELGGRLVLESAPLDVKARVPVWGPVAALDVMALIKAQFDPANILNPGRFVDAVEV